jgi:hypothetical protein
MDWGWARPPATCVIVINPQPHKIDLEHTSQPYVAILIKPTLNNLDDLLNPSYHAFDELGAKLPESNYHDTSANEATMDPLRGQEAQQKQTPASLIKSSAGSTPTLEDTSSFK